MNGIEKQTPTGEKTHNLEAIEKAGELQRERLKESLEAAAEKDQSQREKDTTEAKLDALKNAEEIEAHSETHQKREASPAERRGPITKKQLDTQFNRTMSHVREELPASSRAFSKFIHIKAVEKTSDVLGSTLARPNALLAGAICAFGLTLALYLFAKNMGYRLSGFETIGTFIIGWCLGMLYDYLKVMITGRKDS